MKAHLNKWIITPSDVELAETEKGTDTESINVEQEVTGRQFQMSDRSAGSVVVL